MLWGDAGAGSRIGDLLALGTAAGDLALLALFGVGQLGVGLLLFWGSGSRWASSLGHSR